MSAIVEFRGVGYSVPCTEGSTSILRDLSFTVNAGETLVLLGRSGSGKTTALKMVNRLLAPTSGEVLVEGTSTTAWDPIHLRRRIITQLSLWSGRRSIHLNRRGRGGEHWLDYRSSGNGSPAAG